jgi:hypothetical protein
MPVACYVANTLIRTRRGDVAIEALAIGDLVLTSSGAYRPIRWLGCAVVDCRDPADTAEVLPIRVRRDAFGPNRPSEDLWLSPGHSVCVDVLEEVLVRVGSLVNGATIVQEAVESVTYWHLELDSHDIVIANNMPAESYINVDNRAFFRDGFGKPDATPASLDDYCRPLIQDEATTAVLNKCLRARAMRLGWALEAVTPAFHLLVDGVVVRPRIAGGLARFLVPPDAANVWLISQTFVPAQVADTTDGRTLGLYIGAIRVDDGFGVRREIAMSDPCLQVGFHAFEVETGGIWTSGRALLPPSLWAGCQDLFFLTIAFAENNHRAWERRAIPDRETPANPALCLVHVA